MAEVDPRVSTERNRLTIAPLAASERVPNESIEVTTAGNSVGIAATATLIPIRNSSSRLSPWARPRPITTAREIPAMLATTIVSWSSCRVSGVFSCWTALSIPEIRPTSVVIPVAVTTISPRPRVTVEFM
jgi:hypothetical protein